VYLDGVLSTLDTYASTIKFQQPFFAARNLPPKPHTLSIGVTLMRDVDGSGSWVWIDAFEIETGSGITGGVNASPGRVEQSNAALVYTGDWFTNNNPSQSGDATVLAPDPVFRAASVARVSPKEKLSCGGGFSLQQGLYSADLGV